VTDLRLDGIECDTLTDEDREFMARPFNMEENKEVVFDLEQDKVVGCW
jgi:hypothetical protein